VLSIKDMFNIQVGSAAGWGHRRQELGNEDGYLVIAEEDFALLLVTDGCSGEDHSVVGAWLGAEIIGNLVRRMVRDGHFATGNAEELDRSCKLLFQDIIASCDRLVAEIARTRASDQPPSNEERRVVVKKFMVFTFVAAIITPSYTTVISYGDGVYAVNRQVTEIEPASRNRAAYLAHHMAGASYDFPQLPEYLGITVQDSMLTAYVLTLAVGTDGVLAIIEAENDPFPGSPDRKIGPLSQLWDDPFFDGPVRGSFGQVSAITFWLMDLRAETAARVVKPVIGGFPPVIYNENFPKLMCDDTTIIRAKRKPEYMSLDGPDKADIVELDTGEVQAALKALDESSAQQASG